MFAEVAQSSTTCTSTWSSPRSTGAARSPTRILTRCQQIMASVCTDFGADLREFNGEDDHVHLLVHYPPAVALSKLVNSLKGVSARRLRQEYGPHLRRYLWGQHLRSPSYFAGSCGGAPLAVVKQFIENQKRPDL
jgi:putative transposase